ncbi:hypothetical protein JCM10450v2_003991 [Rhodotorula kratochvilovae]
MEQGGYFYAPPAQGPSPVPSSHSSGESPLPAAQHPVRSPTGPYGQPEHVQGTYHVQPYASTSAYPHPHDFALTPHPPPALPLASYPPPPSLSPQGYVPPYAAQPQSFQQPLSAPPPPIQAPSMLAGFMGTDGADAGHEERDEHGKLSNARMPKKPKPRQPAPDGVIVTDKSCARCRVRKVRCNRVFPKCDHCTARCEDCDLKDWKPKPKVKATDPARVAELEKRLAELEEQLAQGGAAAAAIPADAFDFPSGINDFKPISALASDPSALPQSSNVVAARTNSSIGAHSLDWRLAQPQMASSLSHHLCEAFWESCCFLLPTYEFFRPRMNEFLPGNEDQLSAAQKVALTTFCAVGARTSPHSAVLGISLKPEDTVEHPNAPLLSAGTRRQNACKALFDKAHGENYESGTADAATVENLATLMALLQLSLFAEIHPSKSRPLLRSAISHYRELQDAAATEDERAWIRTTFGFAIYTVDCLISTYARRKCHIRDEDLRTYFAHETRIIVPRLPFDQLLPIIEKVVKALPEQEKALKTAKHLLACWVCACQRAFVQIVAPSMAPRKTVEERAASIEQLWTAIDATRAAAQYVLSLAPPTSVHTHAPAAPHNGSGRADEHHSVHEHDYGAQIVRLDRDLLDLLNVLHVHLADPAASDLPPEYLRESASRVRKALRRRAYYLKSYVTGADVHMTFHELMQLELLPNWTDIALQRVGEPGGPQSVEEEVSETELSWFVEGLQHACYYHPSAEKRLLALAPRLSGLPGRLDLSPRLAPLASPLLASPPLAPWAAASPPPPSADPLLPNPSPPAQPLGFSPSLGLGSPYGARSGGGAGGGAGDALPSPPINFDPLSPLQFGDTGLGGLGFLDQLGGGGGAGVSGASPTAMWTMGGGVGARG